MLLQADDDNHVNMTFIQTLSEDKKNVNVKGITTSQEGYQIIGIQQKDKERITGSTIETLINTNGTYTFTVFYQTISETEEKQELNKEFIVDVVDIKQEELKQEEPVLLSSISDFTFDASTQTITGYTGTDTDIVIPEIIGGVTVVNIGDNAFERKGITSVQFPDTIKKIGSYSFNGNNLISLTLPDNLEIIDRSAFSGQIDESLTGEIKIPKSIKRIGYAVFQTNSITAVTFAKGCDFYCGSYAFANNKIKEVDFSVGRFHFEDEDGTATNGVFSNNEIEKINFGHYLNTIPTRMFQGNKLTKLDLPATIYEIGHECFRHNLLEEVKLNEGLHTIGGYAFANNPKLTSIEIPSAVTKIGSYAFTTNGLACLDIEEYVELYEYTGAYPFSSYHNVSPIIVKKNGNWTLNLKSLDNKLDISRVESVTTEYPYNDISTIDGSYDFNTGIVTFTTDPTGKEFVYNYRAKKGSSDKFGLMSVTVNMDNIKEYVNVTFDQDQSSKQVVVGETYGELPILSKKGYTFKGWNTNLDGTGEMIIADTIVSKITDHTLYPIFDINIYKITFDTQEGTLLENSITSKDIKYGDIYGELPVAVRDGYIFKGWKDVNGKEINKNTVMNNVGNHTLYAQYKRDVEYLETTLKDAESGILLEGLFSNGTKLIITLTEGESNPLYNEVEGQSVISSYEVTIVGEYEGKIKIDFPIDKQFEGYTTHIKHLKSNGEIENFERVVKNGVVSVEVNELSPFIITIDKKDNLRPEFPSKPSITVKPNQPVIQKSDAMQKSSYISTEDRNALALMSALVITSGTFILLNVLRKRKRNF